MSGEVYNIPVGALYSNHDSPAPPGEVQGMLLIVLCRMKVWLFIDRMR